jgi:hypothetical protein
MFLQRQLVHVPLQSATDDDALENALQQRLCVSHNNHQRIQRQKEERTIHQNEACFLFHTYTAHPS